MAKNNGGIFSWLFGEKAKERKLIKKFKTLKKDYDTLDKKLIEGKITKKELDKYYAIREEMEQMAKKFILKDGNLVLNTEGVDPVKSEQQKAVDDAIMPASERHAPPEFIGNKPTSTQVQEDAIALKHAQIKAAEQELLNMQQQAEVQRQQAEMEAQRQRLMMQQQAEHEAKQRAEQMLIQRQNEQLKAQQFRMQQAQAQAQAQAQQQAIQQQAQAQAQAMYQRQQAQQQAAQQQAAQAQAQAQQQYPGFPGQEQQFSEAQYMQQLEEQQHLMQMRAAQQQAAIQRQNAQIQSMQETNERLLVYLLVEDLPELEVSITEDSIPTFVDRIDKAMMECKPFKFGPYFINGAKIIMYRFERIEEQ